MAFFAKQKEQEWHKMATTEIPPNGRGQREVTWPVWSDTETWWENGVHVISKLHVLTLLHQNIFKISAELPGQGFGVTI